ncbi:hypothetical protein Poly24_28440 [Rosistilla carotiformis]|uniref:Uncharacterized protein n=1 Tax=Rosistilla carotiformis TaxID=2528017 RepID=A0A518JUA8_9BACT|nr:hypothetical protein Poly24_28440 [Rosistilla carotiformis]
MDEVTSPPPNNTTATLEKGLVASSTTESVVDEVTSPPPNNTTATLEKGLVASSTTESVVGEVTSPPSSNTTATLEEGLVASSTTANATHSAPHHSAETPRRSEAKQSALRSFERNVLQNVAADARSMRAAADRLNVSVATVSYRMADIRRLSAPFMVWLEFDESDPFHDVLPERDFARREVDRPDAAQKRPHLRMLYPSTPSPVARFRVNGNSLFQTIRLR